MELWTEYEGRTIDGLFPLTKLLRPEGRSAFFLTSNGNGVPRVIRLIEPHFDEDEILARWRGVAALDHPNILKLEKFGQVEFEDGSFLYAVMEPVDANLGEVVVQQRLTLPDARQLAQSLISAIESLHSHGFVHEHIEPDHVFAVGETVKLRSDCIREAPEDQEGQELKRRDLHDFAVVLLEALTQHKTLDAAARNTLPAPFDRIVPRAMNGEWGVTEISAALKQGDVATDAPPAPPSRNLPLETAVLRPRTDSSAAPIPPAPAPVEVAPASNRVRADWEGEPRKAGLSPKWIVIALVAVPLLWLGWHFFSAHPANQVSPQAQGSTPPPATTSAPASAPTRPAPTTAPATKANSPANQKHLAAADTHDQWRVIAYTYNRQDQAQHKADVVAQAHPDLHPEVFTPTGHAPYLVAIGGTLSRDAALALAQNVRNQGLPHDTYAQNYSGKSR
jgi:eukaryotic-like serine/threonine-protein kinase